MGSKKELPFCSNPDCELYVSAGDPGVVGFGNWAQLPDGRIVGRSTTAELQSMLSDRAIPVFQHEISRAA